MCRFAFAAGWLATIALAGPALPARAAENAPNAVHLNGQQFSLPAGFEIELVAGPPVVDRPIVADFDDQGRLYVADSSGSNDKVQQQLAEKPHRIMRLEDADGDGRFETRTLFADRMMFPEGVMWYDGSLYVATPPSIWKLTDADGDGVAERREEWFQGKTLTGCANDLHGPYLGPDGFIYWCKGAFAQQTYECPGRPPFVTRASHIFRCRPDGTELEPVMTGGMDNPVDVVFLPDGERIFTTTFLQHPGGGLRDGLLHAVYGGVYGKVHDVLEGHPRTSPDVMPVLTHLGPAAPCGLACYESQVFGPGFQTNLFAALFNMHKVTRHVLQPAGATFQSTDSDFLVSDSQDFHPTDVFEDADGSLVVLDTGGWYKLCCPTSQLHKPDRLGAIYRIRRSGAKHVEDPRGRQVDWPRLPAEQLEAYLADPRPAVRRRAIATLASRGANGVSTLRAAVEANPSADARRNAVWAASRMAQPAARDIARRALGDKHESVVLAALHSISLLRDRAAAPQLLKLFDGGSPRVQRAAAEALGRIDSPAAVPVLLQAAGTAGDRVLEHSLIYALIEIAAPRETALGLASAHAATQRAALVALDQMPAGGLGPETVARFLTVNDAPLKQTAAWVAGRHADWGDVLAEQLRPRLAADLSLSERGELEELLARLSRAEAIQQLLGTRLIATDATDGERRSVLRVMALSRIKPVPAGWVAGLTQAVAGAEPGLALAAVAVVRDLPIPREQADKLAPALVELARRDSPSDELRLAALAAVPGGLNPVPDDLFDFLTSRLAAGQLPGVRSAAVEVVSRARLSRRQLLALADALAQIGPLELDRFLAAYETSSDDEVGLKLLRALGDAPTFSSLRVEMLKPRLAKFGPPVQAAAAALYAKILVGAAEQTAQLEKLLAALPAGDHVRGQAVFNNAKAACATCHAIGYLGGRLGPDLTRIGQIRNERDLLESVVFPSASFVRSFEPVVAVTKAGKTFSGVLRKDAADEIVLAKGPNEEFRIARNEIDELLPGTVSIMPQGLDRQLTPQELADLVAFLKACR